MSERPIHRAFNNGMPLNPERRNVRGRKPGPQETPIGGGNSPWRDGGSADMATLFTRDGMIVKPGTGGRNSESPFNARTERKEKLVTPTTSDGHAHHWRIEEPNGPASSGTCKGCGVRKEFKNWLTDFDVFGDDLNFKPQD